MAKTKNNNLSAQKNAKKIKTEQTKQNDQTESENYEKHIQLKTKYNKFVGSHISVAGGIQNGPLNLKKIDGVAFAFFFNQRSWTHPPLEELSVLKFKENCENLNIKTSTQIIPHSSYLINLANPDSEKRERSYKLFLEDLNRCQRLNISLYNFHPGSSVGECSSDQAINHLIDMLNKAINETKNVICVVENMSGQKNVIGSKFEDLHKIIDGINDKTRVGICLDTCHLFAAGYDVRTKKTFDEVLKQFDKIVGLKYLKAMHLNDSKGEFNSHLDRHENIGKGKIGNECFEFIMEDDRFSNIPLILETHFFIQ